MSPPKFSRLETPHFLSDFLLQDNSGMWNPRVFADDARGWQCPFVLCLHPQGCLRRGVRASGTIALISHASKAMLKILQARLQQYMNRELPNVQAGFKKCRGIRDQVANIRWIIEKARVTEDLQIKATESGTRSILVWGPQPTISMLLSSCACWWSHQGPGIPTCHTGS